MTLNDHLCRQSVPLDANRYLSHSGKDATFISKASEREGYLEADIDFEWDDSKSQLREATEDDLKVLGQEEAFRNAPRAQDKVESSPIMSPLSVDNRRRSSFRTLSARTSRFSTEISTEFVCVQGEIRRTPLLEYSQRLDFRFRDAFTFR